MSEKATQLFDQTAAPRREDDFDQAMRLAASRSLMQEPQTPVDSGRHATEITPGHKPDFTKRRVIAGVAGAALVAGGAYAIAEHGSDIIDSIKTGTERVQEMTGPQFSAETNVVVAQQGDTLWNIASSVEGSDTVSDLNEVINRIKDMNGLTSSDIDAGQAVIVPASVQG